MFEGDANWNAVATPKGETSPGRQLDLRQAPAVLRRHDDDPARRRTSSGARVLAMLGDSVTTDHISPAGNIAATSPAAQVSREPRRDEEGLQLVRRAARQSRGHGARHVREHSAEEPAAARHRGRRDRAHPERPADVDLRRRDEVSGGKDAAGDPRRQGIRRGLVARLGRERHGAARRARRHRRELRAHPPLEPDRHGRRAAAVLRRRHGAAWGSTGQEVFDIEGLGVAARQGK